MCAPRHRHRSPPQSYFRTVAQSPRRGNAAVASRRQLRVQPPRAADEPEYDQQHRRARTEWLGLARERRRAQLQVEEAGEHEADGREGNLPTPKYGKSGSARVGAREEGGGSRRLVARWRHPYRASEGDHLAHIRDQVRGARGHPDDEGAAERPERGARRLGRPVHARASRRPSDGVEHGRAAWSSVRWACDGAQRQPRQHGALDQLEDGGELQRVGEGEHDRQQRRGGGPHGGLSRRAREGPSTRDRSESKALLVL